MDAAIIDKEDAIWSNEMQKRVNDITDEATFGAFIAPFFKILMWANGDREIYFGIHQYQQVSLDNVLNRYLQ